MFVNVSCVASAISCPSKSETHDDLLSRPIIKAMIATAGVHPREVKEFTSDETYILSKWKTVMYFQ